MRWQRRALLDLLGIEHPIIQAPIAALAAAVANAGALGGFGATDSSPDELREVIRAIRRLTAKPFIINLYLDRTEPYVRVAPRENALKQALAPVHAELQAGEVPEPIDLFGKFAGQIEVVLEERVPVLSTHFGAPDRPVMRALKAGGTRVIATATTVEEARRLEAAGVDAIIAVDVGSSDLTDGTGIGVGTPSFHDINNPRYANCTVCHIEIHGSNKDPFYR